MKFNVNKFNMGNIMSLMGQKSHLPLIIYVSFPSFNLLRSQSGPKRAAIHSGVPSHPLLPAHSASSLNPFRLLELRSGLSLLPITADEPHLQERNPERGVPDR